MTFKDLSISEPILKALQLKKYDSATAIQSKSIPIALKGNDIMGIACTGTGKTAAFALPIIQQILSLTIKGSQKSPLALVLAPTRELAIQIEESIRDYTQFTNIKSCAIFGGVNQHQQVRQFSKGIDILVATPGRLLDLISQDLVSLDTVRYFVLDEADRMLDMGFIHDIKHILSFLPQQRQTMLFSATMPSSINKLSKALLRNPVRVETTPESSVVESICQQLYFVEKAEKVDLLMQVLGTDQSNTTLVFARTKYGADKIARKLNKRGIKCDAIHGNKSQNARQKALTNFKTHRTRVIIATDIAARGIDISDLQTVINFDMPDAAETYVHRIGRTGRAGCSGTALSFCTQAESKIVRDIQKLTGRKLQRMQSSVSFK